MNDSNTNNYTNTDDEASLSKTPNTNPNNSNRTSDIYERFLSRVQSIDSDSNSDNNRDVNNLESLERVKKLSTYEALDEEELKLFENQEPEDEVKEPVTLSDVSEDHKVASPAILSIDSLVNENDVMEPTANDEYAHNNTHLAYIINSNKTAVVEGKKSNSSKLLIIGIVSGLLLSAVIVVLLNTTGILSTSTNNLDSNDTKAIPINTPAANTEQANQNLSTNEDEAVSNAKAAPVVKQPLESNENNLDAEADITYEDFREESQSTLYRETND